MAGKKRDTLPSIWEGNYIEYVSGTSFIIFLTLFIMGLFVTQAPLPLIPVLSEWLNRSVAPNTALAAFSLLVSALFAIALRVGINLPHFPELPHRFQRYLAGLPLWMLFLIASGAMLWFATVYPACHPPSGVSFQVAGRDAAFYPSEVVEVTPGEALTVTTLSLRPDAPLSCAWEYAGPVFRTAGTQPTGCQISIQVSDETGAEGVLTTVVQEGFFCQKSAVFSLRVRSVSP